MKKEIITVVRACDKCYIKLLEQEVSKGDIDLCFVCAGKILRDKVIDNINEEKLLSFINDVEEATVFEKVEKPNTENKETTKTEEIVTDKSNKLVITINDL